MDPLSWSKPHYNLILAIQNLASKMVFTIQWRHIRGHQDGKTITALPWEAWLNIEADTVAKAALDAISQVIIPTRYEVPYNTWVCYVGTKHVVKQFSRMVQMHLSSPALKKYWKDKRALLPCQWAAIHWESMDQAYTESLTSIRWWATKHASSHFSHGKNMVWWKFCTNPACPRYQVTIEDKLHVTCCPEGIMQWMAALKKSPDWRIRILIMVLSQHLLQDYKNGMTTAPPTPQTIQIHWSKHRMKSDRTTFYMDGCQSNGASNRNKFGRHQDPVNPALRAHQETLECCMGFVDP